MKPPAKTGQTSEYMMQITAEEFLKKAGMEGNLLPGQLKMKKHPGKNPSTSYTLVYDWKTDPHKIRINMLPGLSGKMPDKKELSKYALWLQSETFWELDLSDQKQKHKTKH